ncbi:MAG: CHASE2 domain-containing protein [bacterium]
MQENLRRSNQMTITKEKIGRFTLIFVFLLALCVMALYSIRVPFLEGFEAKTYDLRFRTMRGPRTPSPNIAIIAIDERSIKEIGRFPWSRKNYTRLIDIVTKAGAKALLMDVFFPEEESPDIDAGFAAAIERSKIVTLSMAFQFAPDGSIVGNTSSIPLLEKAARNSAHMNFSPDEDGVNRWTRVAITYQEKYYPSLGLAGAMEALGLGAFLIDDYEVLLGDRIIPTDFDNRMLINYRGPPGMYETFSFSDILQGRIAPEKLKNKILFLGATALGIYDMRVSPFFHNTPGVEIHATIADNIIKGDFIRRGGFEMLFDLFFIFFLGFAVYLIALKMRPNRALPFVVVCGMLYIGFAYCMFCAGRWISMIYPCLSLFLTYSVIAYVRFVFLDKKERKIRSMFSSYVSKKVVDQLVQNPELARIGGDSRTITVMFSDVKGYTAYSEKRHPSEVVNILNEYLAAMTKVIMEHDGTLDKFLGDGIMAYWGAPIAQANHPELAVKCILSMMSELEKLQEKWSSEGTEPFFFRIGINTGEVIAGNIGAEGKKMEYTVIGDNVNLSSRLEGAAKYYGVTAVVSESTYQLTKEGFIYRELDTIRVVGKQLPIKIYELVKEKDEQGCDDALLNDIRMFEKALACYKQKRWDEGIELFGNLCEKNSEDKAAALFKERCCAFRQSPPPKNWDGVYERKGK